VLVSGKIPEKSSRRDYVSSFMRFLSVQTQSDESINKQLWNLNYESSHGSEDLDTYDLEEDEQEAGEASFISDKILNGESIEE